MSSAASLSRILHGLTLSLFGLGALLTFLPSPSPTFSPAEYFPPPTTDLEIRFAANSAGSLAALAPAPLRAEIAATLRTELRKLAFADPHRCNHTWRVRSSALVTRSSESAHMQLERRGGGLRVTLALRRDTHSPTCGPPLAAASSAHVAACALNGSSSFVGVLSNLLHGELAGRACSLAHDATAWRPPARVSLLMLHRHAQPATVLDAQRDAAIRHSRGLALSNLRERLEAMLEAAWPGEAAPPAHSDTHLVGTIADAPADALHESRAAELIEACAAGGMRCGNGLPPTLSPTPPLRLLLYAHAPLEPAPKAIDRSGRPLPPGDGFVLPPTGALLPWACDGDNAACLETMHAGLVAVLRRLMGLKESRSERLNEIAAGEAESDLGVHWLEASALQLACVHAHLSAAQTDLRMLPAFIARASAGEVDVNALREHEAAAQAYARNSSRLTASGDLGAACAHAVHARQHAQEAVHHPSLLAVAELPDDYWLSAWPPLFFPIATAVGSALVSRRHKKE